jgi:hypothetical protein
LISSLVSPKIALREGVTHMGDKSPKKETKKPKKDKKKK